MIAASEGDAARSAPVRPDAGWPVAEGDGPEALGAVTRPDLGAAIWRRTLDPALTAWADGCPDHRLPAARLEAPVGELGRALAAAAPDAPLLAADAAMLAARFAAVTGARRLRLRLDVIRDDACRLWHLDRVRARMLCAYRGAGTEFGPGRPGGAPRAMRALGRGDVGVFRGALWPWAGETLLHRSPPMAGRRETRLLLVIDLADACC
jgi:hypothetical protein